MMRRGLFFRAMCSFPTSRGEHGSACNVGFLPPTCCPHKGEGVQFFVLCGLGAFLRRLGSHRAHHFQCSVRSILTQIKVLCRRRKRLGRMWEPASTAPFGRDLELAVIDSAGTHPLIFPCRRLAYGWMNARTKQRVDLDPTHWREWKGEPQSSSAGGVAIAFNFASSSASSRKIIFRLVSSVSCLEQMVEVLDVEVRNRPVHRPVSPSP